MLNWDEYNKDEAATPVAAQKIVTEVVQPTEEVVAEIPKKNVTSELNTESSDRASQARQAIADLDPAEGVKELEALGGRVEVDQKAMINCSGPQSVGSV